MITLTNAQRNRKNNGIDKDKKKKAQTKISFHLPLTECELLTEQWVLTSPERVLNQ